MVVIVPAPKSLAGVSVGWDVVSVEVIDGIPVVCGTVPSDRGWAVVIACPSSSGYVVCGGSTACEVVSRRYMYSK